MFLKYAFVLVIVLIVIASIIYMAKIGAKKEFAVVLAGIATAAVVTLLTVIPA